MINIKLIRRALFLVVLGVQVPFDATANEKAKVELSDYYWKYRPLLMFAPSSDAPAYQSVVNELNRQSNQIAARDMVIIEVFEAGSTRVDGKSSQRESADHLRQRFSAPNGRLTAVLIGKDGGLKLRQTDRFDLDEIFSLIDTMPMRKREMQERK
jgi:hypothetical protein